MQTSTMMNRATFGRAAVGMKTTRRANVSRGLSVRVSAQQEQYRWLNKEPLAIMLGTAGWFVPSNIGVSAFNGDSLFGLFAKSIGENLAHFPTGPSLDDKFWLYMITWHVGLFLTLTLAQIGIQGRKQEYW